MCTNQEGKQTYIQDNLSTGEIYLKAGVTKDRNSASLNVYVSVTVSLKNRFSKYKRPTSFSNYAVFYLCCCVAERAFNHMQNHMCI